MDFIDNATTQTRHALAERLEAEFAPDLLPKGKTLCGRTMRGRTGGCIAPMIECERCRKTMRKNGWQV